jgi:hypothetical protein
MLTAVDAGSPIKIINRAKVWLGPGFSIQEGFLEH